MQILPAVGVASSHQYRDLKSLPQNEVAPNYLMSIPKLYLFAVTYESINIATSMRMSPHVSK